MSNYVPPIGPLKTCTIAIVGEAPGQIENREGIPFVGQAGELLNELLAAANINREDCYLTNVIKFYPKNNRIEEYIKFPRDARGKVNYNVHYIAQEQALLEELKECSANIIIALGPVALYALFRDHRITSWRGSILESKTLPGRKILPIIHPSAALRNYLYRHQILLDLKKARQHQYYPELRIPELNLITNPTFKEAINYINSCHEVSHVGFDIETTKGQVDCFSLAKSSTESMCIPLIYQDSPLWTPQQEVDILSALASVLADARISKVIQNAMFDCTFLYERYGMIVNNIEDTMIAMGVLYPDFRKSLAFIASVFTQQPFYKDDGKDIFKGYTTPDYEKFWRYNARDSAVTLEAFPRLIKDLKALDNYSTYQSHIALLHPLIFIQRYGVQMDKSAMEEAKELLEIHINSTLLPKLKSITNQDLNPNSPKQLINYFYTQKKIKPYLKNSSPTVDVSALTRIARRGFEEASVILEIRKAKKLLSTYLSVPLDSDNHLRCIYNPVGTTTGRLSSRESVNNTGTNRQNQPKEMHKYMLAHPGMVPYYKDLKGAENRLVAYLGPVPAMIKAFEDGLDVHRLTASLLFNIPYDSVSTEKGSAGIAGSPKSQRDMGKMVNHSGNYGVGYKTLALRTDTPETVTKPLLVSYHNLYPEIRFYYQARIQKELKESRTLTNLFNRKRLFLDRLESCIEPAFAFKPQSTIADIINRWGLTYIYNEYKLQEVRLFDQVHDSIGFELPLSLGWEFHAEVNLLIDNSLSQPLVAHDKTFRIPVETKIFRKTLSNGKEINYDIDDSVNYVANILEEAYTSLASPLELLNG